MSLFDTGVRPVIDQWLLDKSKEVRSYGDYWSASSAGYCQRKVIFERLGVPKIESDGDARKQRVFTSGHLFHEWIQGITKKAGLSIAQELELQDEELMIRGHIDDLVLVKEPMVLKPKDDWTGKTHEIDAEYQHLILYDYKTQNSRAFSYKRPEMSFYHKYQLATYMLMLRKLADDTVKMGAELLPLGERLKNLSEARILKISKDDLRLSEEQLLWSPELESEVFDYWNTLNAYWKNKKLPKCTCADQEGGFMALEKWNGYFYEGEPCSLGWYKLWKFKKEIEDGDTNK